VQGAIVIQPEAHSFHKPGSTGNSCIECHMPKTTYMGRDPRREHGFTTPDPRMTKELGIPNACNTCHADKSVDWAVEWSEKWWGPKMERRQRERARVVAAMRHDTNSPPVSSLLALAETEEIAAWKAALGGMLGPFVDRPEVATYLRHTLTNASPLVRSSAVRGLSALPERDFLRPLLLDPVRLVRLDAALALPGALAAGSEGQRELLTYVNFTQDSVVGAFRRAQLALADGDKTLARTLAVRGAGMDRLNPDASVQAAVILSEAGAGPEAVSLLREAMGRSPTNATLPYTLALAVAEQGDTAETQRLLEQTVSLDPTHVRAWYNLSLARSQRGDQSAALTAVDRALALSPRDPEIMQAKASILHNLGRTTEAQAWLQRAQRAR
jgi:tetratricopeptide (TPR) repeat protein